jgi:CheY-like chemotaxis protein
MAMAMEPLVPIVLVVDEDARERALATAILKRGGCGVVAARNGEDALETFGSHAADISILLIDAQLRPVAGVTLPEAIRLVCQDVPIILTTRSGASVPAASLSCHQIVTVLQKPLQYEEVGLLIRQTLAERLHIARCAAAGSHTVPHVAANRPAISTHTPPAHSVEATAPANPTLTLHWPPTEEELAAIEVVDAVTLRPVDFEPNQVTTNEVTTMVPLAARREQLVRRPARQLLPAARPAPRDPQSRRLAAAVVAATLGLAFVTSWEIPGRVGAFRTGTPVGRTNAALRGEALIRLQPRSADPRIAARSQTPVFATPAPTPERNPRRAKHDVPARLMARSAPTPAPTPIRTPIRIPAPPTAERTTRTQTTTVTVAGAVTTPQAEPRDATSLPLPLSPSPSTPAVRAEARPASSGPHHLVATEQETASIYAALGQYRTAYARLDVKATRAVWPSVDARALARAFSGLREQQVVFSGCSLAVNTADATAICGGRATFVTRVGSQAQRSEPREWRFRLKKAGDVWTIAEAATAVRATP